MKRVVELALNEALAEALVEQSHFRNWFLSKTRFACSECECVLTRSDNPWTTSTFDFANAETGVVERITRQGETDVLAVFQLGEGRDCFALHVENKLAHSRFTKYQPEGYAARAAKWVGNPRYGTYQEWQTVLVAPASFRRRYLAQVEQFGASISHEEIAEHVPAFRYTRADA